MENLFTYLLISVALVTLHIFLVMFSCSSVSNRAWLGVAGLLTCLLGVTSGYGIVFLCGGQWDTTSLLAAFFCLGIP